MACASRSRNLRPATFVMAPRRLLAAYPTALSFARSTVAHLARNDWTLARQRFDIDAEGVGSALYRLDWGGMSFHFVVVSKFFASDQKTDRSFGQNWDISASLCEGPWSAEREVRLLAETPKQRAGRFDYDTLVTLRGNRSARAFDHVVDSLAAGRLPDAARLSEVGYLVRTTGLIANGAMGMRPYEGLGDDHPFAAPYCVQIVAAMLFREFVFELVDAMAARRSEAALRLPDSHRRYLGVGNAAGAGLVAYLAANPMTVHRWVEATETAIAEAWRIAIGPGSAEAQRLAALIERAVAYLVEDGRDGNAIFADNTAIARGLQAMLPAALSQAGTDGLGPDAFREALGEALAAQELATAEVFHALMVELLPQERLQAYRVAMRAPPAPELDFAQTAGELGTLLGERLGWTLDYDFAAEGVARHFWYRSAAAPLDPRLGVNGQDPGAEFEWRMDTAWRVAGLKRLLDGLPAETPLAHVLAQYPEYRDVARRCQALLACPYGELHENRLDAGYTPFAAMRLKLALYGMDKLDPTPPKSVRGALLQGAPTMADLMAGRSEGDWPFPLAPPAGGADPAMPWPVPVSTGAATGTADPPPTGELVCSPIELRRLVTRALHGTGLPLGVADGLALSVESAELRHGGAFAEAAALIRGKAVRSVRLSEADIDAGATGKAAGLAALSLGQSPVELACLAARQGRTGSFSAAGVLGGRLVEGLLACGQALNCAVVMIRSEPGADGLSLFVPTGPGAGSGGIVSLTTASAGERDSVLATLLDHPAFAGAPPTRSVGAAGIWFLAAASAGHDDLWAHAVRAAGPSARVFASAEAEALHRRAMRRGIRMPVDLKAELEDLSKAVLVPAGASSGDRFVPGGQG